VVLTEGQCIWMGAAIFCLVGLTSSIPMCLLALRRGESPVPSARGPSGEVAGGSRRPQIPTPGRKKPSAPVSVSGVPRLQLMSPGEGVEAAADS